VSEASPGRLLGVREVCERLGIGRSTLLRVRTSHSGFPAPVALVPGVVRWRERDIEVFIVGLESEQFSSRGGRRAA
jgi:predicted DNA-binding transcriptional regulator AlpA